MSARDALHNHYRKWKELTLAEGEAIEAGAWSKVDECQTAKFNLQAEISTATDMARTELKTRGKGKGADELELRSLIEELIQLEQQNSTRLTAQRAKAEQENDKLSCASRNLRSVKNAYAPVRAWAWQSYS